MNDARRDRVTCNVCEAESEHAVTRAATEDGAPDLDTRPPETLRSTMPTWVQRCPSCGYCAPDLEASPPRAERVVKTAAYQSLLAFAGRPPLASAFLAASAVYEAGAAFADAGGRLAVVKPNELCLRLLKQLGVDEVITVVPLVEVPSVEYIDLAGDSAVEQAARIELVRQAHQNLSSLNDLNRAKFSAFLTALDEDLNKKAP